MDTVKELKQLILLDNLKNRFEYNEKKGSFTIAGVITKDEYDAFIEAVNLLREKQVKQIRKGVKSGK